MKNFRVEVEDVGVWFQNFTSPAYITNVLLAGGPDNVLTHLPDPN